MDYNFIKDTINLNKTVLDTFSEEKADFDIIIPDYCGAASKILKCDVIPVLNSKTIENDKIIIEGTCIANLIYSDENSSVIRSIGESCEFRQTYSLKEKIENPRINVKLRISNIVCRLQNPRRISVKSLVGVAIKVMGNSEYELITGFEDCDTEAMFESFEYCPYVNSGSSNMHISGEMLSDETPVEIIKNNALVIINDTKMIKDKAIIKGEAYITCLFAYGENVSDIKTCSTTIPFSDVIEVDGADEECICNVVCSSTACRCDIGNSNTENIINIEIETLVDIAAYNKEKIKLLKDVYSRKYDVSTSLENISVESLDEIFDLSKVVKECFEIDINDATVDDISAKPVIKNISINGGELLVEGEVGISVVIHNSEEVRTCDKSFPFSISKPIDLTFTKLRCEAEVICEKTFFSIISDNKLEIECNLKFCVLAFSKNNIDIINDIQLGDKKDEKSNCRIVLYYAEKGETLWDIAKKFSTSIDIIKRDNAIESSSLKENCMLLVSAN